MKKNNRIKLLFGRFAVVSLLIVAQVVLTVLFCFSLGKEYILNLSVLSLIIEAVVILFIVNRYEPAAYKLPWIIVILVFPVGGIVIYILFGSPKISYKIRRRFKKARKEYGLFLPENSPETLAFCDKDGAALSKYVYKQTQIPVYYGAKCEYYSFGEEFFVKLKEALNSAEEYILMEYFIIGAGDMWNEIREILLSKAKSGVRVCLLYDDVGSIGKIPNRFDAELRKEGIECYKFNPFIPVLSGFLNNRDHRKITIVDGKVAFTGGINLADEYINLQKPYGRWKDSAVKIEGEAVNSFVMIFIELFSLYAKKPLNPADFIKTAASENAENLKEGEGENARAVGEKRFENIEEYFDNAEKALARGEKDFERLDSRSAAEEPAAKESLSRAISAVQPFCDGPRPFHPDTIAQNVYEHIIYTAKEYLYITTPYIIIDHSLCEAIRLAAERGVDVRIFTPHIPDKKSVFVMTRSHYEPLIKGGVKIYEYGDGFMHSKNVVSDDRIAVVGTVNLDYRSFVHHYECGAIFYGDKNSEVIKSVKNDFLTTASACGILQDEKSAKLNPFQKLLKVIIGLFAPML